MSLGFGPLKTSSKYYVAPAPAPTVSSGASTVKIAAPAPTPVRADFQTFYDPSRVIDVNRIKVVSDLRTEGSERGEVQTGDNGTLGPGSNNGVFFPQGETIKPIATPAKENNLVPVALAIAAFILLGS